MRHRIEMFPGKKYFCSRPVLCWVVWSSKPLEIRPGSCLIIQLLIMCFLSIACQSLQQLMRLQCKVASGTTTIALGDGGRGHCWPNTLKRVWVEGTLHLCLWVRDQAKARQAQSNHLLPPAYGFLLLNPQYYSPAMLFFTLFTLLPVTRSA